MEKQFDEICNRLGIGEERERFRPLLKAFFDAGVEYAEQKIDEEIAHVARAAASLG